MEKQLERAFIENKEQYLEHLLELIRIDTQDIGHGIDGGREGNGQRYMMDLFQKMGATVRTQNMTEELIQQGIELYGEGNPGHNYEDRFNVVAEFTGLDQGQALLFNGHIDTMPPGNLDLWEEDPWKGVVKDGRAYGVGAADMKGGLMAAVMAVRLIQDAGLSLPVNVKIASVVDEEGGGNGSIALAVEGIEANGCVVCEPTERNVKRAHMGFVFFEIKTTGKALHSGSKWLGVNAIEKMIFLMEGLRILENQWLMEYKHPILPPPTLNFGVLEGGTAGSTVPDECTLKICVHYLPNTMSHEMVVDDIQSMISLRAKGDLWLSVHPPTVTIYQSGGGFETSEDAPIVKRALESLQKYIPDAEIVGATAGNDARIFGNIAKIPTVIAGPGHLEQCHSPNEYVDVEEFYAYIKMYADLILNWNRENN